MVKARLHGCSSENQRKKNRDDQRITAENKPHRLPVGHIVHCIMLHQPAAAIAAHHGAYSIGHHHKQSLRASDVGRRFFSIKESRKY